MEIIGKKKVSQQLIEFLLVVPFMVIILGILTEYAYALNINMTLTQGLKAVTSSYCSDDGSGTNTCYGIYDKISPTNDKAAIETIVTNGFDKYLKDNNVPNQPENNTTVKDLTVGQTTIFYVKYTYIPAFTLPMAYFKFLPDKFDFFATVAVPAAFLGDNSAYTIDTDTLTTIWAGSGDLSNNPSSFDSAKKGALNSDFGSGSSSEILFLVYNSLLDHGDVRPSVLGQPYELTLYDGSDYNHYAVDMANGTLYWWEIIIVPLSPPYIQTHQISSFSSFLPSGFYQVVFMPGGFSTSVRDDLLSLSSNGNYDDINSSGYVIKHFGSIKIVYPTSVTVNQTIISPDPQNKPYF